MATFSGLALACVKRSAFTAHADHSGWASFVASPFSGGGGVRHMANNGEVGVAAADKSFECKAGDTITVHWGFEAHNANLDPAPNTGDMRMWVGLYADNSGTQVAETQVLNLAGGWTRQDSTGTTTFAISQAGTYRLRVRLGYAQNTADGVNGGYTATSDDANATLTGTPNTWQQALAHQDRGYVRAGVDVTAVDADNTTTFDGPPSPFAWPDTVRLRATVSHTVLAAHNTGAIDADTLNGATPVRDTQINASSSSTTWSDAGGTAQLDKTDPTSFGIQIGVPVNSSLSSRPFLHFETAPTGWTLGATDGGVQTTKPVSLKRESYLTWDGRLTVNHHLQKNNNTFDAALDVTSRLTSDLGFVTFTLTNARGEAVSGVTATETLTDDGGLVAAAVNRSVTTGANGRPSSMASWDSQLPGGGWTHTVDITSPAGVTDQEITPTATFTLLASSPSIRVVAEGGPALADRAKHFDGTGTFQTFVGVIDVDIRETLSSATSPAVSSAEVALFRVAPTGAAQYLNASNVWTALTPGVAIDFHTCTETAAGSGVFVKAFTADDTWGASDVVCLGRAVVGGTPYGGLGKEIVVGSHNSHDTASTLAGLSDVDISAAKTDEVLGRQANGTWTPRAQRTHQVVTTPAPPVMPRKRRSGWQHVHD